MKELSVAKFFVFITALLEVDTIRSAQGTVHADLPDYTDGIFGRTENFLLYKQICFVSRESTVL